MVKSILLITCLSLTLIINGQSLSKDAIRDEVASMISAGSFNADILQITEPINNVQAVLVNLPYRDFPNILIFSYEEELGLWHRVYEGLNPGIQDAPSGHLDWHTKGFGIDFTFGEEDVVMEFNGDKVKTMMRGANSRKSILIPYQHFLHMQTFDPAQAFTPYTIDKTQYYDFAITLFGELYKGYSKDECMMFDSPNVDHIEFSYLDGHYQIVAVTSNQQVWTYTFKGVGDEYKYLLDKHITVATK